MEGLIYGVAFAVAAGRATFTGTYSGSINGTPTTMTLQQKGEEVSGEIDSGGYRYGLEGEVSGKTASGVLSDAKTGGEFEFEAELVQNGLRLTLAGGQKPVTFEFARAGASSSARVERPSAGAEGANPARDMALVGVWAHQEVMSGGGYSVATQVFMEFTPEGIAREGNARTMMGGASASGDTGHSGETQSYEWRTENGILYVRSGGNWIPGARYYVEGNKLMITGQDGKRILWYRQEGEGLAASYIDPRGLLAHPPPADAFDHPPVDVQLVNQVARRDLALGEFGRQSLGGACHAEGGGRMTASSDSCHAAATRCAESSRGMGDSPIAEIRDAGASLVLGMVQARRLLSSRETVADNRGHG